MKSRRRSRILRRQWWQRGFTLIELMVIVAIIGILGAVAAPSFASMMDGIKVAQSVTNLQTALQDTQRQAIRKGEACTVQISTGGGNNNGQGSNPPTNPSITGNCLTSGSPSLPSEIKLATNMQSVVPVGSIPITPSSTSEIKVKYGTQGSAEFSILSAVQLPLLPKDPTGKVVVYTNNSTVSKRCVAISSTLGLTRVGTYTGSMTPAAITDTGICTALDWKQQ